MVRAKRGTKRDALAASTNLSTATGSREMRRRLVITTGVGKKCGDSLARPRAAAGALDQVDVHHDRYIYRRAFFHFAKSSPA